MAWIEKLHATYEACKGREPPGTAPLMPISHTPQQAHIEIAIDGQGRVAFGMNDLGMYRGAISSAAPTPRTAIYADEPSPR